MAEAAERLIKLTVSFEADNEAGLLEAVESFLEDLRERGKPNSVSSLSTNGWRYQAEVKP